ncbi:uncharacterized protein MEPE_06347 [Melanopsichium pennsylvanicum]|uniref:Uncharacterized protein n=1 Tax=Melanopsichium pennsylvanicum TaxID=63383 RepID=A0AAJ4XSK0_9BASI|nr:uncharacterized protein MEPE_06347 [Melanopsichium pennsylvanicum]
MSPFAAHSRGEMSSLSCPASIRNSKDDILVAGQFNLSLAQNEQTDLLNVYFDVEHDQASDNCARRTLRKRFERVRSHCDCRCDSKLGIDEDRSPFLRTDDDDGARQSMRNLLYNRGDRCRPYTLAGGPRTSTVSA